MNTAYTSSADFFEAKYRGNPHGDPWSFATSEYELERYGIVMNALAGRRYRYAYEPGCSVGVLTEQLASVCDQIDACDFSATAVEIARKRCQMLPGANIRCAALLSNAPWAKFDLIVLSEIGYYFTATEWRALVESIVNTVRPGTVLLASHWLGASADHMQRGDEVHEAIIHPLLDCTLSKRYARFRLDRWTREI